MEGPVFSEYAGWAYLSGHDADYHPFILRQLALQEMWDESGILERLAGREFTNVLIQQRLDPSADWSLYAEGSQRFSGDFFLTLLRAGYRPVMDPQVDTLLGIMGRPFTLYRPIAPPRGGRIPESGP